MVFLEVAYSVVLHTVLKGTKLTTAQKCSTSSNQENARENSVQCRMQKKW